MSREATDVPETAATDAVHLFEAKTGKKRRA
jgi:hypothetical protein